MTKSVSVVIPHYGDPALAGALVSQLVAQQGAPEFEIIIVDDDSPTPYPADERVRLIRRETNGGFGAAVNAGAAEARHPLLLVLNSDLSVGATFLREIYDVGAGFQPAVVSPAVLGPDGLSQWAGRKFPRTLHYFVEWLTILARFKNTRWRHSLIGHDLRAVPGATVPVDWVVGAAMLILTDEFRAIGGFDESFHMNCEEVDLQRRLRARGVPSIFAGTVAVTHAGGASSGDHAARVARLVQARLRYAQKWGERPALLRASLTFASLINLAINAARSLAGRPVRALHTVVTETSAVFRPLDRRLISARPGDQVRIGFVTPWKIEDQNSWSGVIQPMYRALSTVAEVVPISTADVSTALPDRVIARLHGMLSKKTYLWEFGLANAWKRGRAVSRRINEAEVDYVLAVAASVDIAFARCSVPVFQVSDATFSKIVDFYPMFTGLSKISRWQANLIAEMATARTDHFLATSEWAAASLAEDYGVSRAAITVAPLGPAIEPSGSRVDREPDGPLRVLVVAADWERKRGDACVQAIAAVRASGLNVQLAVVGRPPSDLPPWVTNLGFLSHTELSSLYSASDVLLDLSVATAASVVATDAASHGLPVIAMNTGGTASIVADGKTGFLLSLTTFAADQVVEALRCLTDRKTHARMSALARQRAADRLNWSRWASDAAKPANSDGTIPADPARG